MGSTASILEGEQSYVHEKGDGVNGDIRRNVKCKESGELVSTVDADVTTLAQSFAKSAKAYPKDPFLGVVKGGTYVWQSWETCFERAMNFAKGLLELGAEPGEEKVGIFSANSPEWTLAAQACNATSLASVALYDTLGPDAVVYIANQSEVKIILVSSKNTQKILDVADKLETCKYVIQMDGELEKKEEFAKLEITLHSFAEVEKLGGDSEKELVAPKPDTLATICYTSGTTGDPKGVMLSHGNLVADLAGLLTSGLEFFHEDVHISYLPLAHMFERMVQEGIIVYGARIGFFSGDITKLMDDIALLRPTFFPSVPRLFNRLYDKITAAVEAKGGLAASLFHTAYDSKKEELAKGYLTHSIYDRLVFGKVRERLGGRVRFMVTGAAPLSPKVLEFLKICFSCPVLNGYGQTETAAAVSVSAANDVQIGHVGPPIPACEIRLVSVPEMDYLVTDNPPRGEVCYRGANICQGYYKMPEKTADTIDKDGWLHSGDIGTWTETGCLKIIDRKKNIFKLAQGEYVAPEKIENVYARSAYVAQSFVYGNSLKASLIAIVIPDFEVLIPYAKENGIENPEDQEALCKNEALRKMIMEDMRKIGKETGLHGFEQIRAIHLAPEAFSVENNILTPTFKLKRPQAKAAYQEVIDELYKDLQ